MKNNIELSNYFDLSIPEDKLYSKGKAIEGEHGIEELEEEYYVSEFHLLKSGVANTELKGYLDKYLEENGKFSLSNKAKDENKTYHEWPQVVYSDSPDKPIKKYKLSWLVEAFIYPNKKYAKEIDICRNYIGGSSMERFSNLVSKESSSTDDKLNEIRKIMESMVKSLQKRELIPNYFTSSKPVKVGESLSFLSGNLTSNYLIHENSILPESVVTILNYILSIGHKGSHDSDELNELMSTDGFKYLQRANTLLLIDIVNWYKSYIDGDPKKNDWSEIGRKQLHEGMIVQDKNNTLFFKTEAPIKAIFIPHKFKEKFNLKSGDKVKATIQGIWKTGNKVSYIKN